MNLNWLLPVWTTSPISGKFGQSSTLSTRQNPLRSRVAIQALGFLNKQRPACCLMMFNELFSICLDQPHLYKNCIFENESMMIGSMKGYKHENPWMSVRNPGSNMVQQMYNTLYICYTIFHNGLRTYNHELLWHVIVAFFNTRMRICSPGTGWSSIATVHVSVSRCRRPGRSGSPALEQAPGSQWIVAERVLDRYQTGPLWACCLDMFQQNIWHAKYQKENEGSGSESTPMPMPSYAILWSTLQADDA